MFIEHEEISRFIIHRMALYHSTLKLMQEEGITICISNELGRRTGLPSHQIRKDLAYFGEFGTKGVGYQIDYLLLRIEKILGYDTVWNAVLVGLNIPVLPIMSYSHFCPSAVEILEVIDLNNKNHGTVCDLGLPVAAIDSIKDSITSKKITIGIIAIPPSYAQKTANQLIQAGVKGIVNFSTCPIFGPEHIAITQISIASWFSQLTFALKQGLEKDSC